MSVSPQAEVQSPPWDDMDPLSAGHSSRAFTPPSQAVAPVTGVSVRGGRFNNSASANNNFSLSLFNLILGPRDHSAPSGAQSELPSLTYSRLLLPKADGFPLYDPQPPGWLNSEYRSEGVRIGDVGIITSKGSFDFLFNICHTAEHPINRRGVPNGFSPPQWAADVVFAPENCREPGEYVINGSIQALESDRTSGDYHFKGSPGEAAVLVIPAPTIEAHARNTRDFRDYAAQNAVEWYKFVTEGLRLDVHNGSMYLITGWEKTQSWGTASFEGNKYDFELAYGNKIWVQYGPATAKRGPRDAFVPDPTPCNQCIFLNGYKTMLGESLWDRVLGSVQVSAVGDTATTASSSGSRLSMGTSTSLGGSLARWFYPSGQAQGGSTVQHGLGMDQNDSDVVVLESTNPATVEDVHPSNLINRFLLHKFPEAEVAITHDNVWCSLVKEPGLPFQNQIESLFIINSQNGAVYLTRKANFVSEHERAIATTYIPRENPPTRELSTPSASLPSDVGNLIFAQAGEVVIENVVRGADDSPPPDTHYDDSKKHTLQNPTSHAASTPNVDRSGAPNISVSNPEGSPEAEWLESPRRKPMKKALLVGIRYENEEGEEDEVNKLHGPHQDVMAIRQLLIEKYQYAAENIVVLIDDDQPGQIQPTRRNMLRALKELVEDAQPGDRYFFHYAGHTVQLPDRNLSEEDGLVECIIPCDGKHNLIRDDELRHYLVDPLPAVCNLVAVFDSCYSASLLGLEHFRCNRVYVPWISNGKRRSDPRWNNILHRQTAWPELSHRQSTLEGSLVKPIHQNYRMSDDAEKSKDTSIDQLLVKVDETRTIKSDEDPWYGTEDFPIVRSLTPEALWPCTGWCQPVSPPSANVMSIAAFNGYQSWDGRDGGSIAKALIKALDSDPHPSMAELMKSISHELYKFYLIHHSASREFRKRVQSVNKKRVARGLDPRVFESPPEMDNFQDPELASAVPLPPGTRWDP